MQRRALNFHDRVETPERNDGDSLGVIPGSTQYPAYTDDGTADAPDPFPPQFLRQHDGPHSFAAILRCCLCGGGPNLSFIADDLLIHAALYHAEEHRLHGAVEFVVLRPEISRSNVGKNGAPNEGAEGRRGSARKQGEQGPEKSTSVVSVGSLCSAERGGALDGSYDILVPQHNQVLNEVLPGVWGKRPVVLEQHGRQVRRKLDSLLGIALRDLCEKRSHMYLQEADGRDT